MDTATLTLLAQANSQIKSRRAFAKKMGVADTTVLNWESGQFTPNEEHIVILCEMAVVDPAEFLMDLKLKNASPRAKKVWAEAYRLFNLGKSVGQREAA